MSFISRCIIFFLLAHAIEAFGLLFFWSAFGLLITGYELYLLLLYTKNNYPVGSYFAFILMFQCIVSPWLDYITTETHFKYYMRIEEEVYMGYAVPALFLFSLGMKILNDKVSFKILKPYVGNRNIEMLLICLGVLATIFIKDAPSSLRFVFYLLALLKFVGAIMMYWRLQNVRRFYPIAIMLFYLLYISASSGFFHELILWILFLFPFLAKKEKIKMPVKVVAFLFTGFCIIVLQSIKFDFRDSKYEDREQNVGNLTRLLLDRAGLDLFSSALFNEINVRFNQGWIVSSIMKNVPENQDFARGGTVLEAVSASILPRFFNQNKKKAGGRENFEKYTGLYLGLQTSMGMGILGEAYANYGLFGGMIFMFLWGLLLSTIVMVINKQAQLNPLVMFFIPILFFQAIKAETELVVVLNHMIKASILLFLLFKLFGWYQEKTHAQQNKLDT